MAKSYDEKTVDELRDEAREREISGASDMRKDELVRALSPNGGGGEAGGGERTQSRADLEPKGDSKSLEYSQTITSPGDEPERPGRSLVTRSHEVIRQWAEERGAVPATVPGTEHGGHRGVLRFDFPGYGGEGLEKISWDEWLETFDERNLNFIYQEQTSDGSQSNFFRLDNPDREDA